MNCSPKNAEVRLVPVFPKRGDSPSCWVQPEAAQQMVEDGSAQRFRSKGFAKLALRLTEEHLREGDRIPIRDKSCQMGPAVMFANAIGDPLAMAATQAWQPTA